MPYYITDKNPDCSGWAVEDADGVVFGCHKTKQGAIDQAVAVSLATEEDFVGERAAVDSLAIGDYVSWNPLDPEILAEVVMVEKQLALLSLYEFEDGVFYPTDKLMVLNILKLERIAKPEFVAEKEELPEDLGDGMAYTPDELMPADRWTAASNLIAKLEQVDNMTNRDKWLSVAWAIKSRLDGGEARSVGGVETRTGHVALQVREGSDGMTFEGYAAVFNSPSEPLPFTEVIAPGAFKRSLQGRHRMMLLWNHDASQPLASTRNGSMRLTEDAIGLWVSATFPNTTLGRDIAEQVRSGLTDSMSFGFQVKKDSWSADGSTRTLHEVALHEVSLVSFPAYEGTAGSVSVRSIDADVLADGLLRLESGEELSADQAATIKEVVDKLSATEEVQAVDGDILALKKKKLDLLVKGL